MTKYEIGGGLVSRDGDLTFDWSTQNDFYCSDESFKTPLESPGGESEYYYNGFNGMKAMNGYVDVSEAFTIHDRMSSQSFDSN